MKVRPKKSILPVLPHIFNGLVLGLILYYGIWFTSDARYPTFHFLENYYVNFSQALLKGQIALLDQPDPRLAYLQDTHQAPDSGIPFLWDVSYFHGKYYIYWGPTPVIYYLAYTLARGKPAPAQLGVLSAYGGIACTLLATLYLLRQKFFPRAPVFSIGIFLLAACINPPYTLLLSRPLTYETAILTGQFFLLLGIFFWVLFLIYKKGWLLVLAGLPWGLAVLARYDTVISVAVYTGIVLFYLWKTRPAAGSPGQDAARNAGLLILPLAVCALGLEFYNAVRFGNPLETGLRYQLTTPVETYYSPLFFASNLYVYLFYPNPVELTFPFIGVQKFEASSLPGWASPNPAKQFDYGFFGLFRSLPIFWIEALAMIALSAVFLARWSAAKKQAHSLATQDSNEIETKSVPITGLSSASDHLPVAMLQVMLLLTGLLQLFFLLFYYYSAVRFLSNFWLPLLFAGFLIFWELDRLITNRICLRVLFWLILVWAALQTALAGYLSGFTLFPFYFAHHNLDTYYEIKDELNMHFQAVFTFLKPSALLGRMARAVLH
jgi:hypothetical protein